MSVNIDIRCVDYDASLRDISELVTDYAEKVHNDPYKAVYLMREMKKLMLSQDHLLTIGVDKTDGSVVSYAFSRIIDNYGELAVYIVSIYSARNGGAIPLVEYISEWGRSRGCRYILGIVSADEADASCRLWSAKPEGVVVRREI